MKQLHKESTIGFTLIELLIVIVIISILSGVLIALINPTVQQNRARDAAIMATMNKMVLNAEGFISAYGTAPRGIDFYIGIQNVLEVYSGNCLGDTDYLCTFSVTGAPLPLTCDPGAWTGSGSTLCHFRYASYLPAQRIFYVWAKSFGLERVIFQYTNDPAVNPNRTIQKCTGLFNPPTNCTSL